jgi:hypothetical protein
MQYALETAHLYELNITEAQARTAPPFFFSSSSSSSSHSPPPPPSIAP